MFTFAMSLLVKTATTTKYIPLTIKEETPIVEMIDSAVDSLSSFYGYSADDMRYVINCESGWNINAINSTDPNGGSFGILQFQKETFRHFSSVLGIDDADINNPFQQIEVASYMWGNGLQNHWSCFKKLSTLL